MRKALSSNKAKRVYHSGTRQKGLNHYTPMRGGTRVAA